MFTKPIAIAGVIALLLAGAALAVVAIGMRAPWRWMLALADAGEVVNGLLLTFAGLFVILAAVMTDLSNTRQRNIEDRSRIAQAAIDVSVNANILEQAIDNLDKAIAKARAAEAKQEGSFLKDHRDALLGLRIPKLKFAAERLEAALQRTENSLRTVDARRARILRIGMASLQIRINAALTVAIFVERAGGQGVIISENLLKQLRDKTPIFVDAIAYLRGIFERHGEEESTDESRAVSLQSRASETEPDQV